MADYIDVAQYQAEQLFEHLSAAKWMSGTQLLRHRGYAKEHLAKCASALGFDLVKRQPVDDKALEMHFSDGAIPAVTDKPGFDNRAPAIADNEWSR